ALTVALLLAAGLVGVGVTLLVKGRSRDPQTVAVSVPSTPDPQTTETTEPPATGTTSGDTDGSDHIDSGATDSGVVATRTSLVSNGSASAPSPSMTSTTTTPAPPKIVSLTGPRTVDCHGSRTALVPITLSWSVR